MGFQGPSFEETIAHHSTRELGLKLFLCLKVEHLQSLDTCSLTTYWKERRLWLNFHHCTIELSFKLVVLISFAAERVWAQKASDEDTFWFNGIFKRQSRVRAHEPVISQQPRWFRVQVCAQPKSRKEVCWIGLAMNQVQCPVTHSDHIKCT